MAEASLQDRLRDHAKAFDGLLSLIPAKMYYGEDNSDQWQRKKQTKQEAAAARRGKLDPDSELNRNAKEVMDERAKNKRKLREMEQEQQNDENEDANADESFDVPGGVEAEKPGEGLKRKAEESNKKQKLDTEEHEDAAESSELAIKLSKKEQKKAAKKEKKAERKAEQKANRADEPPTPAKKEPAASKDTNGTPASSRKQKGKKTNIDATPSEPRLDASQQVDETGIDETPKPDAPALSLDMTMEQKPKNHEDEESTPESDHQSPMFDMGEPEESLNGPASTTTSISSTVPPSEKPKQIKIPADTTALKARLAAKIAALRAARKADGPDGKPIRTRQELIESRRAKQAQRKAHKKELRQQAKLEEDRKREEALASNSPGVMSPAVELDENGSFSFGRVAFGDGSQMSHDLSYVLNQGKKKGPSDPKTALLKVQNQKKRMQELDSEKRGEIAEKEAWLTARRRIEGEKIRDDEAMLKKAVKRKETAKKKSEKAWKERARGVGQAQKERQKKREENLQKRRDEKLMGKAGKKKGGAKKKKVGRPGFEGSLGVAGRRK
ncbi:hypothetical protein JDV02_003733 [Purpureocillium takamizusanense]|uniref:Ribosomal RNA-processing protein 14/surfeit locus protein 6 C-terminal domain-containing protein n=1 Tax=Purpureocillium takamizusanense TaxID=2060973 RepID=A0A9Q8VA39_9HYPO|nr:uncharacterized protein JDV02_003733 [Purpureocillium takamizusanense]UNI17391.1 hypothetical protein JDV02_003733 [Purpureocillium takamizusanense]